MPNISIFKNISEVQNPEIVDLIDFLEKTRDGEWQDLVLKCRTIKDKEERDAFKRTMPTATLSGLFAHRKDSEILEHSGYLNIDLDDVENVNAVKRTLATDKYVFAAWTSTGGKGLRIMFRVDPQKHREAFRGISQYLFEKYGLIADHNGVNVSKPYVVSFDPFLYINPDEAPVWTKYPKETAIKKLDNFIHNDGDFELVLKQITGRGINICESYQDWLKVGFAISDKYGESGRGYFHDVSRQSPKYVSKTAEKQYDYILKARGGEKANISTFYYLAKINGVKISSEQTKKIVRATRNGKQAGLKPDQIIEMLAKHENITNADKLVGDIFTSSDDINVDESDSIIPQLEMYISNNYKLRMNDVTGYLEHNGVSLSQSYLNSMFISAKKLIPKLDYQLMIRLLKSDFIEMYNPFFEFFGSDGIPIELPATPVENEGFNSPLIDLLAATIKNQDPLYTTFFLRKWMVGVISAAHKVHSPLLLCLLGAQNSGKTEFFRRLPPKELMSYYAESKLDKEKDDELLMTENLWIMDDELGGKSKQDNQKLKNITSKQWFSLRRPYGEHNEKILRIAVLCGTSNYNEVMSDPTGNRRIIPIEVEDIDKELYNSIDKTELWHEAFRLYKEGFDWRITKNDIVYLNKDQAKYEHIIKERELIAKFYEPGEDEWITTSEMVVEIEYLTRQKLNINAMGRELEKLGFVKKSKRDGPYSTSKRWGIRKINRSSLGYPAPQPRDTPPSDEPDVF